jgi:uncharacterized protein
MMLKNAALLGALLSTAFYSLASAAPCRDDRVTLRDNGSVASFTVEIADTDELRSRGLMFRESLPQFSGMLFIYDAPTSANFWMRNTPLPLDMLFIDETGVVTRIGREAVPFSEEIVPGGDGVLMVLEINGGTADLLGLSEGAQMQYPGLDQSIAVWPCDPQQ